MSYDVRMRSGRALVLGSGGCSGRIPVVTAAPFTSRASLQPENIESFVLFSVFCSYDE